MSPIKFIKRFGTELGLLGLNYLKTKGEHILHLKRDSLQEQAYHYLSDAILKKELKSDIVYSEQSIADDLKVSRTPIREAVIRLRNEGLLEAIPGRGFIVRVMDNNEVLETYQIRSAIEGYCAMILAQEVYKPEAQETFKILQSILEVHRAATQDLSVPIENLIEANRKFHGAIVEYSKNTFFVNTFRNLCTKMAVLGRSTYSVPGRREVTHAEHLALYDAILSGNPAYAYRVAVDHEEVALRSYLVFINKFHPDELINNTKPSTD